MEKKKRRIKGDFQVSVDRDFSQSRKNICHLTREKEKKKEERKKKRKKTDTKFGFFLFMKKEK